MRPHFQFRRDIFIFASTLFRVNSMPYALERRTVTGRLGPLAVLQPQPHRVPRQCYYVLLTHPPHLDTFTHHLLVSSLVSFLATPLMYSNPSRHSPRK